MDVFAHAFLIVQLRGVQHRMFLQRSSRHLHEDAALDVIGQLRCGSLVIYPDPFFPLRDRTVEFLGVD